MRTEFFVYQVKVGSRDTSKTVKFSVVSENPEKAINIALNLASKQFQVSDSLGVVDIKVKNLKNNKKNWVPN